MYFASHKFSPFDVQSPAVVSISRQIIQRPLQAVLGFFPAPLETQYTPQSPPAASAAGDPDFPCP